MVRGGTPGVGPAGPSLRLAFEGRLRPHRVPPTPPPRALASSAARLVDDVEDRLQDDLRSLQLELMAGPLDEQAFGSPRDLQEALALLGPDPVVVGHREVGGELGPGQGLGRGDHAHGDLHRLVEPAEEREGLGLGGDLVSGAASHSWLELERVQGGALALGDAQRGVRRAPRLEETEEAEGRADGADPHQGRRWRGDRDLLPLEAVDESVVDRVDEHEPSGLEGIAMGVGPQRMRRRPVTDQHDGDAGCDPARSWCSSRAMVSASRGGGPGSLQPRPARSYATE